jgi:hypothetical protein
LFSAIMGSTFIRFSLIFLIIKYLSFTLSVKIFLSFSLHFLFFFLVFFLSPICIDLDYFSLSLVSRFSWISSCFLFWRACLNSLFLSAFVISFFGFWRCLS